MNDPLIIEEVYNASIEEVWQVLIDENKMRIWYFPQLQKFKPIVGFKFVFNNDGSSYQKEWIVTKVEEGRLFAHSWSYLGYPGNSEVQFELIREGESTRLILNHAGLNSFPSDPHFARIRFENGWKQILGSNLRNCLSKKAV
jgi:uncharacterized protein YndB with AHSA1/START domain